MKINDQEVKYYNNHSLLDYLKIIEKDACGALVNGKIVDLNYVPSSDDELKLVSTNDKIGFHIYEQSLVFLLIAAINRLYKHKSILVNFSYASGIYITVDKLKIDNQVLNEIKSMMDKMIEEELVISSKIMDKDEAIELFEKSHEPNSVEIIKNNPNSTCQVYFLDGNYSLFWSRALLTNTNQIKNYSLRNYADGIWLSINEEFIPQRKLFDIFSQFEKWGELVGVTNILDLNHKIEDGKFDELVLMSEIVIENQFNLIVNKLVKHHPKTRFILVAGPSSAGKTTFSRRLALHLKLCGKKAIPLSMDDFYKDRSESIKNPDGSYDFESPEALDLKLFKEVIDKLTKGEACLLPHFDFKEGKKTYSDKPFKLQDNEILIIEGIHGLNPLVTDLFEKDLVFKIYINALTHLNIDDHNRISTSEYRLIRRITRDYQFRNYKAIDTIKIWESVRKGEDKYIYPYQENADFIFNSSMVYELAIIKNIIIDILKEVDEKEKEYYIAKDILALLENIKSADSDLIPKTSILAEFIGNSYFDVH